MQHWTRRILNAGVSLSVVGGGVLLAEGAATAHDAVDHDGPAHHGVLKGQVLQHRILGVVASVGTGTFTITTHRGVTKTITTTSTTVFAEAGTPVVPVTVAIGQNVAVALVPTNPVPTATRVVIELNRVSGKVLAASGTNLTLSGPRNSTHVVTLLAGTMFFNGTASAGGATVGQFVTAFGSGDPTTPSTFDALFVDIASAPPQPVGTPVVPSPVQTPNPGLGHRDDQGEHDQGDNDNDFTQHANGDDNDANEHTTTPTTGVPNVQPPVPGAPSTRSGNGASGDNNRGGPGPSNGGGDQGDRGGSSSGGGSGSGGHGGRG